MATTLTLKKLGGGYEFAWRDSAGRIVCDGWTMHSSRRAATRAASDHLASKRVNIPRTHITTAELTHRTDDLVSIKLSFDVRG